MVWYIPGDLKALGGPFNQRVKEHACSTRRMHAQALSRAFRSRFLELHVGDIPDAELATILQQRCALAPSYSTKLVAVMRELQRRRQVCCPDGTACKALTIFLGRVDIKL